MTKKIKEEDNWFGDTPKRRAITGTMITVLILVSMWTVGGIGIF